jgi:Glycosyltransferase family 87
MLRDAAGAPVRISFRTLLWFIVALTVGAAVYAGIRVKRDLVDLSVYRTAGARVLDQAPLYRAEDGHYQFKYLPAFALAVTPLGLLSEEAARAGWFTLSAILLIVFVRQAIVAIPNRRSSTTRLAWLAALVVGRFYLQELALGQTNVLFGVTLLAALQAARTGRRIAAGTFVGIAVFVKPYALIFLPWLAVTWGVAALVASLAAIVAGLAAPAFVYGWTGNLALLHGWFATVTATTAPNLSFPENVSLMALWTRWLGPGFAASGLAVASGLGLAALGLVAWLKRRTVDQPDYLEFALLLIAIPLISPQGWDYVLLLGTPAVLLVVDRFRALPLAWRGPSLLALLVIGLTIFDLLGRTVYEKLMDWSVVSIAAIVLALALVTLRRLARA